MTGQCIAIVAIICLYSTGHWIGATVLLSICVWTAWEDMDDPSGVKRWLKRYR